jgi:hypothetical protein
MAYRRFDKDGYTLYQNESGPAIGTAGVPVIELDGCVLGWDRGRFLVPHTRLAPERSERGELARSA